MADVKGADHGDDEVEHVTPGYKAPAEKSLKEINELDADDEALQKYKDSLGVSGGNVAPAFPDDPRRVIVTKLSFCPDGRDPMDLDLTGSLDEIKKHKFTVKEGCSFRLKIEFYVQREIVSGLRYNQVTYRKGIKVDKDNYMVGSYGPKSEPHVFTSPSDETPSGMLARGEYTCKSVFLDDDRNRFLEWEWKLKISKDWSDSS